MPFQLFIDGDSFPNLLKPIILRAISKRSIPTYVVSNKKLNFGAAFQLEYIIVSSGPDEADNEIINRINAGDLVITSDIELAGRVVDKKAYALSSNGEFYDENNVKQALAIRNLMQSIRDTGELTKGPPPFSKNNVKQFANQFNQFLSRTFSSN